MSVCRCWRPGWSWCQLQISGRGKSDTVLVDFKMTALDYLRAERRNIKFGEQDTTRSWQPTVTVTLADNSEYPVKGCSRLC